MKIGMNLLLWTTQVDEKTFAIMEALRDAGYDGVEIPLGEGGGEYYGLVRAQLDSLGLSCSTVTSLGGEYNPVSPDAGSIERGKVLFIKYCASCHGTGGKGDGPVAARLPVETPDLTRIAGVLKDGDLAWKIATGRSPMPKWGDKLTEEQIWDIVNFIRHLQQ